ncbi:MAG: 5-(carboxyamino)imidazole ribonucleotide synthase [Candidatus Rokubacteria bacterium]|nr:5-(carboxyamino)imidazole ribonucleotide synthase [Candidatus Rokubacteria bacterium]
MIVGVLGGGQLGRMLALAGHPLGLTFRFLDPSPEAPVRDLGDLVAARWDDEGAAAGFARGLDVLTYELEHVPMATARALACRVPTFPPPAALEAAQDRLTEKTLFEKLGIPTAPFSAVETRAELGSALARLGAPAVVKTRRLGYDGKGQAVIRTPAEADVAWDRLGGGPLLVEGLVPFDRELSLLAVRSRAGAFAFYPLVENEHRGGILRLSRVPAPGSSAGLQARAEHLARRILEALEYVGVLAVELFQVGDRLLANEMAPRVHNSGHWTIEGAVTSQFENHIRAILGWPLGTAAARGPSAMLNLIGTTPDPAAVLAVPGAHLHLYGKAERAGRKLGHITVTADRPAELERHLRTLRPLAGLAPDERHACAR